MAPPGAGAGLAEAAQVVLGVADLADGGATVYVHLAHLAALQAHLRIVALARDELHAGAGGAPDLRPASGLQLHAVDGRADRGVAGRERRGGVGWGSPAGPGAGP